MTRHSWLHAVGMFVLGAVSLIAVGVAFVLRVNRPLPITAEALPVGTAGTFAAPTSPAAAHAVTAALQGVTATLRSAADALESGRGSPAPLLDGARRVAQVIDYSAPDASIRTLRRSTEQARSALQNGNRTMAMIFTRQAITAATAPTRLVVIPAVPAGRYRGAIMLDTAGDRIGTVIGLGDEQVIIETPSLRNILGFITLTHGSRRALRADSVLFGEPAITADTFALSTF